MGEGTKAWMVIEDGERIQILCLLSYLLAASLTSTIAHLFLSNPPLMGGFLMARPLFEKLITWPSGFHGAKKSSSIYFLKKAKRGHASPALLVQVQILPRPFKAVDLWYDNRV